MADATKERRETHQIINLAATNWKEHSKIGTKRMAEIRIRKSSCQVKILWGIYIPNKWTTWFHQVASFRRMVYFIVWRNSNKMRIRIKSKSRLKVQINWISRMPQDLKQNVTTSTSANLFHHRLKNKISTLRTRKLINPVISRTSKMLTIYKTHFCLVKVLAVPQKMKYIIETKGFLKTASCSNQRARTMYRWAIKIGMLRIRLGSRGILP